MAAEDDGCRIEEPTLSQKQHYVNNFHDPVGLHINLYMIFSVEPRMRIICRDFRKPNSKEKLKFYATQKDTSRLTSRKQDQEPYICVQVRNLSLPHSLKGLWKYYRNPGLLEYHNLQNKKKDDLQNPHT